MPCFCRRRPSIGQIIWHARAHAAGIIQKWLILSSDPPLPPVARRRSAQSLPGCMTREPAATAGEVCPRFCHNVWAGYTSESRYQGARLSPAPAGAAERGLEMTRPTRLTVSTHWKVSGLQPACSSDRRLAVGLVSSQGTVPRRARSKSPSLQSARLCQYRCVKLLNANFSSPSPRCLRLDIDFRSAGLVARLPLGRRKRRRHKSH